MGIAFEISSFKSLLKSRRECVLAVAFSALAAHLFDESLTAHSVWKSAVPVHAVITCNIDANFQLTKELQQTKLIL